MNWIINFEIVKGEDNLPELIVDEDRFVYLRQQVDNVEQTINSIVSKGLNEEDQVTTVEELESTEDEEFPF